MKVVDVLLAAAILKRQTELGNAEVTFRSAPKGTICAVQFADGEGTIHGSVEVPIEIARECMLVIGKYHQGKLKKLGVAP